MSNPEQRQVIEAQQMEKFLHKARSFNRLLLGAGIVMAFGMVLVITYLWLFYNP